MSTVDAETRARAVDVASSQLNSGDPATRVSAAGVVATFELADVTLAASRPAGNDRACVQTILRAARVAWASPQQELDAIYEALRQYGHTV